MINIEPINIVFIDIDTEKSVMSINLMAVPFKEGQFITLSVDNRAEQVYNDPSRQHVYYIEKVDFQAETYYPPIESVAKPRTRLTAEIYVIQQ